jgi:hypothetical protein
MRHTDYYTIFLYSSLTNVHLRAKLPANMFIKTLIAPRARRKRPPITWEGRAFVLGSF